MRYQFLIKTYETERFKVVSVWSFFRDAHHAHRPPPRPADGHAAMLNHDLHSNYGPTADTEDKVAYAYPDIETFLKALDT
jgi:hypothetical protein